MNLREAMFIINKKTKEIRDFLSFCEDFKEDAQKRKHFRILMRMLCVPETDVRLDTLRKKLIQQKAWLYALKYTLVKRDGVPVGVARKETDNGSELYLLIKFEGITFHIPATEADIMADGFTVPSKPTEPVGAISPALAKPISDKVLREAVAVVMESLGETPLLSPPNNVVSPHIDTMSVVDRDYAEADKHRSADTTARALTEFRHMIDARIARQKGGVTLTTRRDKTAH